MSRALFSLHQGLDAWTGIKLMVELFHEAFDRGWPKACRARGGGTEVIFQIVGSRPPAFRGERVADIAHRWGGEGGEPFSPLIRVSQLFLPAALNLIYKDLYFPDTNDPRLTGTYGGP